ncbi:MAG: peroxiredoxin-like family protein [Kangiellaceae bacterium]|jgi:peroxiredoxin|nr:peroxiredoxin-like family protein [Kangiellaceae bacterium]
MRNLLITLLIVVAASAFSAERNSIAKTADEVNPLLVGQTVPSKPVWTPQGKPVRLTDLAAEKPLVLVFYRGGWCPYCNHQLNELKGIEGQLTEMGYQLVAVSPELPDTLKKMQKERELDYTLLSDFRIESARAFGIAFSVEQRISNIVKERYGSELQRFKGESQDNLPVPAVFIIDKEGVIQFSYVNPNYNVRLHPELLLKAAEVALKGEDVRLKR